MEYKVERFQISPCFAASRRTALPHNAATEERTHVKSEVKSNKSTTVVGKSSSQSDSCQQSKKSEKSDDANVASSVALDLCSDGSKINISINGTTLTATETSLNAIIGNFTISINSNDACTPMRVDYPVPPSPDEHSLVAVVTTYGKPLHIAVEGNSADVKATLSLTNIFSEQNTYLVTLYSDGQGGHFLSANNYSHYITLDSDNNIQALTVAETEDLNADKYTFKREEINSDEARYYLETDGNIYYLMVTSDEDITCQHSDNLASSQSQCTFSHLYG